LDIHPLAQSVPNESPSQRFQGLPSTPGGSPFFGSAPMDRQMIIDHLEVSGGHVESTLHVERQRRLITEPVCSGHSTGRSEALLAQFEKLPAMHIADRDRLLGELRNSH